MSTMEQIREKKSVIFVPNYLEFLFYRILEKGGKVTIDKILQGHFIFSNNCCLVPKNPLVTANYFNF